ncbi:DUF1028 domain-containing protein [Sporolactobacillus nakayamae]|uniref:Uncharacterized conserved protein, Ntn-hydrolase superfamily n=1 Tax=Sporolactobacillus nakayamae TaxID=269670 RepID=A0A1I2QJ05_9BACL|nr:DUF1028 domain-containing protein [Sporolactobacillus nakayamae]SFG27613.1 Uncharacterized conserved protein, Ntn-hydrolase superfamily [Sporolactobacillus nakayamae]
MTYSIVAKCKETGYFGAAVTSCFPGIGAYSPTIKANIGIIASQGWVNPTLGPIGIKYLEAGKTANETLNTLLMKDPGRELRQLIVMDHFGNSAVYTGVENDDAKGHIIGDQFAVQGNILTSLDVVYAVAETFERTNGPLQERLLAAMLAGDKIGGDARGKQAAAIKVVAEEGFPYVDFRVDDSAEPIQELNAIYKNNKHVLIDDYYEWIDAVRAGVKLQDRQAAMKNERG